MAGDLKYIDVILPLPVSGVFTYFTDLEDIQIGQRVVVQFGSRKLYSALVSSIHNKKPVAYEVKPLIALLDRDILVNDIQLQLWNWIADYYMCNLGNVMVAALPASFFSSARLRAVASSDARPLS